MDKFMEKFNRILSVSTIVCFGTLIFLTHSVQASSKSASASVEIFQQIAVSEPQSINFGSISAAAEGDTISIQPDGTVTTQNGSTISGGSVSPGQFAAAGSPNASINISFTDGTLTGSGPAMQISNFQHNAGGTPTFDEEGNITFNVGADLIINSGQVAGSYSGTYEVSISYP